jgi:hypothetical protein
MVFPIDASPELVAFCTDWHDGQWSSMYSVLSTGQIHSADYLRGLASELRAVRRMVDKSTVAFDGDREAWLEQFSVLLATVEALEEALPEEE